MKICPQCGDVYPAQATVCRAHGIPLREWPDATEVAASAQGSGAELSDDTEECVPLDLGAAPEGPTGITPLVQVDPEAVLRSGPPRGGRTLGDRYRLDRRIGIGGYGAVFDAYDTRLHKRVAVKVLSPALSQSAEEIERFRREAIAASRVRHEGIVDVTDLDRDADGTFYIVMEYLGGVDLSDILDAYGSLEPIRALEIAEQCANALAAAHDVGIIHRDLKPANIFLTTTRSRADTVKIIDFGISKIQPTGGPAEVTSVSKTAGTPAFMSPEQARQGGKIDGRTDVYSLGVILFLMLTGELPFKGSSALEILTNHLTQPRVPPSEVNSVLRGKGELDRLVLRAVAIRPERRYASMEEFAAAIRGCAASLRAEDVQGASRARDSGKGRTAPVSPLPRPRVREADKRSLYASREVTQVDRVAARHARVVGLAAVAVAAFVGLGIWGWRTARSGASHVPAAGTVAEPTAAEAQEEVTEPAAERAPPAERAPTAEREPEPAEPAPTPEREPAAETPLPKSNTGLDFGPKKTETPEVPATRSRKRARSGAAKKRPTATGQANAPAAKPEPPETIAVEEW